MLRIVKGLKHLVGSLKYFVGLVIVVVWGSSDMFGQRSLRMVRVLTLFLDNADLALNVQQELIVLVRFSTQPEHFRLSG